MTWTNTICYNNHRVTVKEADDKFREAMAIASTASESPISDPLAIAWDYVCWFEEKFPSGKRKMFYPILVRDSVSTACSTTFCLSTKSAPHFAINPVTSMTSVCWSFGWSWRMLSRRAASLLCASLSHEDLADSWQSFISAGVRPINP